jgi:hypothetical protein
MTLVISDETIISKIYFIRGKKVMLDSDLADLYQVDTRILNQAINRHPERFPEDFMFQLGRDEYKSLQSAQLQISTGKGGRRKLPYAFTEQGVAMLSSILTSDVAIKVNIHIIRLFTKMREMLMTNKDLLLRMEKVERTLADQGTDIETVFNYLDQFIKEESETPREKIGFKQKHEKQVKES